MNEKATQGDIALPNIQLTTRVNQKGLRPSDGNGLTTVQGLAAARRTPVRLDTTSLPDVDLVPSVPGFAVLSREGGSVALDYPLFRTAEIEGRVVVREGGRQRELANVQVRIINALGEMVAQSRSEFDGAFVIEGVPVSGIYRLEFDHQQLQRTGFEPEKETRFEVGTKGGIKKIGDVNLVR